MIKINRPTLMRLRSGNCRHRDTRLAEVSVKISSLWGFLEIYRTEKSQVAASPSSRYGDVLNPSWLLRCRDARVTIE